MKPILETERLILRPLESRDYLAAFEWCGDPEVNKYMIYPLYTNAEDVKKWIDSINQEDPDSYDYGFVEKETGLLIGSGGLYYHADYDVWNVGYNLRKDTWGKGYTTEALKKIIEHVNNCRQIREIQGVFAIDNPKSGRVMEKLGLSFLQNIQYTKLDNSITYEANLYSSLGKNGTIPSKK